MNKDKIKIQVLDPTGIPIHEIETKYSSDQLDRFLSQNRITVFSDEEPVSFVSKEHRYSPIQKLNKDELISLAVKMGLETYNVTDKYFCVKGVNGHATTIHYDNEPIIRIKNHLLQMGRDSLKMDLNNLLSITTHH